MVGCDCFYGWVWVGVGECDWVWMGGQNGKATLYFFQDF